MPVRLRSDDRVLFLQIPRTPDAALVARTLTNGLLVGLGTRQEVDAARIALRDFDNVMFVESEGTRIPWQDSYFTKIVVSPQAEAFFHAAAAECQRVLAPGGEIATESENA